MSTLSLSYFESKGWRKLTNGCYGAVYHDNRSDWIIKQARNDGTRTYLEWCLWRIKAGRRMRGMPEIDWMIPTPGDDGGYMLAMRKYQELRDGEARKKAGWSDGSIRYDAPDYIKALLDAFEEETGVSANDVHHGNVMFDAKKKEAVVTDPSSAPYKPSLSAKKIPTRKRQWEEPEFELVG